MSDDKDGVIEGQESEDVGYTQSNETGYKDDETTHDDDKNQDDKDQDGDKDDDDQNHDDDKDHDEDHDDDDHDKDDDDDKHDDDDDDEVVPCFTPGTTIATPKGERRVEDLRVGDRVITRDNGIQEIRWLGTKSLNWDQLQSNKHLRPVMIKAGALGNGLPERDMLVSPNHRMLVANDKTAIYFEEREVLAATKHLTGTEGIMNVETLGTTYIHFMFDHHEVVLSNGAWSESFQPGDYTLKGLGNSQRSEIFELFPELRSHKGVEGYTAARKTLKKHEAQLLVAL